MSPLRIRFQRLNLPVKQPLVLTAAVLPPADIVAVAVAELTHVPPAVALDNVVVPAIQVDNVPVIADGTGLIVTTRVAIHVPTV